MDEPDDVVWSELGEFAPSVPPSVPDEPRVDLGPGGSLRQAAEGSRRNRLAGRGPLRQLRELSRGRWSSGEQWMLNRADTERGCAETLARLEPAGWTVLHDRLLPGGEHRLAHVAVGPAGLVVVTELPDTGPLAISGDVDADGTDTRQLYAGDLHLGTWLNTRRWEAGQLEQAVAARYQDCVWSGPTTALAVEVPPTDIERPAAPPEMPYEWGGVLLRPVRTVPALLTGLPAPLPPSAVDELTRTVANLCRPAGRPHEGQSSSNSEG